MSTIRSKILVFYAIFIAIVLFMCLGGLTSHAEEVESYSNDNIDYIDNELLNEYFEYKNSPYFSGFDITCSYDTFGISYDFEVYQDTYVNLAFIRDLSGLFCYVSFFLPDITLCDFTFFNIYDFSLEQLLYSQLSLSWYTDNSETEFELSFSYEGMDYYYYFQTYTPVIDYCLPSYTGFGFLDCTYGFDEYSRMAYEKYTSFLNVFEVGELYELAYSNAYEQGKEDKLNELLPNLKTLGNIEPSNVEGLLISTFTGSDYSYWYYDESYVSDVLVDYSSNGYRFNRLLYETYNLFEDSSYEYGEDSSYKNIQFSYRFIFKEPIVLKDFSLNLYGFNKYDLILSDDSYLSFTVPYENQNVSTPSFTDSIYDSLVVKQLVLYCELDCTSRENFNKSTLSFTSSYVDNFTIGYDKGFIEGSENASKIYESQIESIRDGYDSYIEEKENEITNLENDYKSLLQDYNNTVSRLESYINEGEFTLTNLFWSIGSIPFESFKEIWTVDFLRL